MTGVQTCALPIWEWKTREMEKMSLYKFTHTPLLKNYGQLKQKSDKPKKKKKRNWINCPCASAHGHFCPLSNLIFSLQFSLHFEKKTFWQARGENTRTPLFIFLPSHTTKHTPKKIFLSIFFPKFSIHPILPPNKHTLSTRYSKK